MCWCVCVEGVAGGWNLASNKNLRLDLFYFHEFIHVYMVFNNIH